jgi:catechol 2,3-dioxygenase-like lactoylglutathione lyase family enzyme
MIEDMGRGEEGKGEGVVIPPEMVKELEKLSPEERHQRLRRYVEIHGEDVKMIDGWTPYGPKIDHTPRLDHVQIAAPPGCEAEARRFFGELLGLTEIEKPAPLRQRGGVWFSLGEHQLHVGVDSNFSPARKAHPALRVTPHELDVLASRLSDAGAEVSWDDDLPLTRRFYTSDPWGSRIEILAAEGRIGDT